MQPLLALQDNALLAYQVCFDLFENEMQSFLLKVSSWLDKAPTQHICAFQIVCFIHSFIY